MFLFKKIVSQFLFPLPLCLIIAFAGLYFLWFTKKQKTGKCLVSLGVLALFLLSYHHIAGRLLFPLESQYPALTATSLAARQTPIRFVVVLGHGHATNPELPITGELKEPAIVRLAEGIRIHRLCPGSKLILTGGRYEDPSFHSQMLAELAMDLGVKETAIITETRSRDTRENAQFVQPLVGNQPFALVTSASHMPRSMALFQKAGMNPIAAPTDHLIKKVKVTAYSTWFPSASNLRKSEIAVYETLGLLWAKLRSQI